jgi:hypothetical protein
MHPLAHLIELTPLNRRGGFLEAKINQKYQALNPKFETNPNYQSTKFKTHSSLLLPVVYPPSVWRVYPPLVRLWRIGVVRLHNFYFFLPSHERSATSDETPSRPSAATANFKVCGKIVCGIIPFANHTSTNRFFIG